MSINRYAARRDANESPLIDLARSLHWWMIKTDEPADWWGCFRGRWFPIEIKTEQGDLTTKQVLFHSDARARNAPVLTWRSEQDVLRDSGARGSG